MEAVLPLHILFIPRWYPSKSDPMRGLFIRKHALAAVAAGFRVTVVYAVPDLSVGTHLLFSTEVQSEDRLTEVTVCYRAAEGIQGTTRQLIAWNLAIKTAIQHQGKPNLIHAHVLTRTALIAWWCGFKWKVPFVITEHWSRYYPENMQYHGLLRRYMTGWVIRRAKAMTVVSQRLANAMHAQGLRFQVQLMPNVVDTSVFTPALKKDSLLRVVSISCFEEKSKNLHMLVDAMVHISSHRSDIELVMIGDGSDYQVIRAYVAGQKMRYKTVRFTGLLQDQDLAEELQQASCLAITSNYETFGIVAYEAFACGIPVVATDVADLSGFIDRESGIVVKAGDAVALAVALEDVLDHPDRFDRIKMHDRVEAQFSSRAVAARLKEIYNGAIGKTN